MIKPIIKALSATAAAAAFCVVGCGGDGYDGGGNQSDSTFTDTSGSAFTDSRDKKKYRKVTIGAQTWMAQNLDYAAGGSACYLNSSDSCSKYGRLYSWETALTACPPGWHLPSDAEWAQLTDEVGGLSTAGVKLKLTSGWVHNNGMDEFGFSAMPGGYGYGGGFFGNGDNSYWWSATATEDDANSAWGRHMNCHNEYMGRVSNDKNRLLSVRCVLGGGGGVVYGAPVTYAGEIYQTVIIGNQTWLARNLNYAGEDGNETGECFNGVPDSCEKYGRMYDWNTALTVCPAGWHLPSDNEWLDLMNFVGSSPATKLKTATGWSGANAVDVGTDDYGFSALPGGRKGGSEGWRDIGSRGNWWTATEYDNNAAMSRSIRYSGGTVYEFDNAKHDLHSVRCVKN